MILFIYLYIERTAVLLVRIMIDFRELPFHADDMAELMKLDIDFAFQPIFHSADLSLYGYEALMRPKGKNPLELIAEYAKLGKLFVIELATCFGSAMAYRKRGYTEDLCINSFPSEYLNDGQARLYRECFPDLQGKVVVEIVEYTELNQVKWGNKKLDLKRHNMRLSLDDFSTGKNDMEALEYFKPDFAKLDRSLISNIHNDKNKQEYVQELVEMFHKRGVQVIAEGIETKEEMEYLKNNTQVDYFQGYYLGMPA